MLTKSVFNWKSHGMKSEIYCKDCQTLLWNTCLVEGDHKSHSLENIDKAKIFLSKRIKNFQVMMDLFLKEEKKNFDIFQKIFKNWNDSSIQLINASTTKNSDSPSNHITDKGNNEKHSENCKEDSLKFLGSYSKFKQSLSEIGEIKSFAELKEANKIINTLFNEGKHESEQHYFSNSISYDIFLCHMNKIYRK